MTGKQLSSNIVVDSTNSIINEINNSYQSCISTNEQNENIGASNNNGSTITINNVSFQESAQNVAMCEQTANFTSNVTNAVNTQAQQAASAVATSLRLFQEEESQNLTELYTTLATNINNTYQGSCTFTTLQNESVSAINNFDSTIDVNDVTFSEDLSVMNNCILSNSSVQDAQQQIQNNISQSAASKSKGIFSIVAIVIIVGILIVGAIIILLIPGAFSIFSIFAKSSTKKKESSPQEAVAAALQAEAAK